MFSFLRPKSNSTTTVPNTQPKQGFFSKMGNSLKKLTSSNHLYDKNYYSKVDINKYPQGRYTFDTQIQNGRGECIFYDKYSARRTVLPCFPKKNTKNTSTNTLTSNTTEGGKKKRTTKKRTTKKRTTKKRTTKK